MFFFLLFKLSHFEMSHIKHFTKASLPFFACAIHEHRPRQRNISTLFTSARSARESTVPRPQGETNNIKLLNSRHL